MNSGRLGFWAFVLIMSLAGNASAQNSIVPGQSIGPWRISAPMPTVSGSTKEDKALKPRWVDWIATSRSGKSVWPGAFVVPDAKSKTLRMRVIRVASADFKTAGGLSTSSQFSQISRAFPSLRLVAAYDNPWLGPVGVYDAVAQGITFDVLLDKRTWQPKRCLVISVHAHGVSILPAYRLEPEVKKSLRLPQPRK